MTSRYHDLGGFQSFRTPNSIRPMDPSLIKPKRYCTECGATLRQSNPGPKCCPCEGVAHIPEWAVTFLAIDDRISTAHSIAGMLTGEGTQKQIKSRNEGMRQQFTEGMATKQELATSYGLSWDQVDDILAHRQRHKRQR